MQVWCNQLVVIIPSYKDDIIAITWIWSRAKDDCNNIDIIWVSAENKDDTSYIYIGYNYFSSA